MTEYIEKDYLEMYPDVQAAINKGLLKTGYEHYIKYGKAEGRHGIKTINFNGIKNFPGYFTEPIGIHYPQDMVEPFEEYFFRTYDCKTERVYLPILWTAYHVNHNFGKDLEYLNLLHRFIETLDKTKKYYTILNYDDGCLCEFYDIDIIVFTGSGKGGTGNKCLNIPIPLLTTPHAYIPQNKTKDIFCSFVGRFENHNIRGRLKELFENDKDFYFNSRVSVDTFCDITARSKFVLCPRGYGYNSFRISEALQYGSIPVYISDIFTMPFGIEDYFVKVYDFQVSGLKTRLQSIPPEAIDKLLAAGDEFYKNYCLYPALKQRILETLKTIE